ncbi:hypothetical protein [Maribacter aurantiacus]|uniref:Uncharacterized protein n=1 Tax=Maribacter aurantiacus TaxID=1882343 RepID=A0A5R8MBY9_9FLAO|nr:hypothetical protein [Maribacter aurantiacus]TLF47027.1 hypothetical protein FEK29_04470 [Maribacter aurantiacus]
MRLYDFMMLNAEEQMAMVISDGTLVTRLEKGNRFFVLYSLGTFYFEMEFDASITASSKERILLRKRIFKSGKLLDKYVRLLAV